MTGQANTALARKLSAGQGSVAEPPRSILRALRLGLARAAGEGFGLPLSVIGAKQSSRAQADLADKVPDRWLLLVFSTTQAGPAAICLDPGCVSAIVQQQTIGMVISGAPSDRAFTDTDAAMAAPLFEEMMIRACGLVEAPADVKILSGFEYSIRAETVRALTLAMADERYRVAELTVELAGGAQQGEICIVLPDPPPSDDGQAAQADPAGRNLEQASGVMRAELTAVLSRISLPLTDLSALAVGDVLPLTGSKLDKVQVLTIERGRLAVGRLGQCGGMRAVRINEQQAAALTHVEPQPFMASQTGALHETAGAQSALNGIDTVDGLDIAHPSDAGDLLALGSDELVSEISQLARLSGEEGEG